MIMKTPDFWYRKQNELAPLIEVLLAPFSHLYSFGSKINHMRKSPHKADIPVICVGNIIAGGSGKTPTIISLCQLIKEHKLAKTPYFLTRGYGAQNKETRVISGHEPFSCTGDEPALLMQHAKTILSGDRPKGVDLAQKNGADVILMDDGLQNNSLYKDLSFLVIDGTYGLGNKKILPAGPLREQLHSALSRAQAIILIGTDQHEIKKDIPKNIPVFGAHIQAEPKNLSPSVPHIAFAGLGMPEKFKKTLLDYNFNVMEFHAFTDHHAYTNREIEKLLENAEKNGAQLITTEKDHVRIPEKYKEMIKTLPIRLIWDKPQDIVAFLKTHLDKAAA